MKPDSTVADVCLIVEGAYPYVAGGVSSWVHDLITTQSALRFHLVVVSADESARHPLYEMPRNVIGVTRVALQNPLREVPEGREAEPLIREVETPLNRLLDRGGRRDFAELLGALRRYPRLATRAQLVNSQPAFDMIQRMYESGAPGRSFLGYFWSWRSLAGGLFSVALASVPRASVYHAVSTGYAGLMLARAVLESGRPGMLTEHGIYTNERRIEIAMAEWLIDKTPTSLDIEKGRRDLHDLWLDAFVGYSHACYETCSRIITLYTGNQRLQQRDGAALERMMVIPNGIDCTRFGGIRSASRNNRPTVALIGRVVPIKDVKCYIRAAALVRSMVPDARLFVMGATTEDPDYFAECRRLVAQLGMDDCFKFTGPVRLPDVLGEVDVVVLTSISEAQPLVLLEAGAAGIPSVAPDVGSCRELIEGLPTEQPALGSGGFVTAPADPVATARAIATLLRNPALRARCGTSMRERTRRYYNKDVVDSAYRQLYQQYVGAAGGEAGVERVA
jgi:glycosyltransferase involved in cell wall biosynthesis